MTTTTTRWLLIAATVALLWALGVRLPVGDTAAALLAMVVAGIVWRNIRRD